MSIEQRLEELTEAITTLPSELAKVLASVSTPAVKTETGEASAEKQPKVDDSPKTTETGSADKDGENVAGRKTYVWDKKAHTGQIVEKGEVVPTGDNLANVGKAKWEQLCTKYELDPATGQPAATEEASDDLGDLDDLPSDDTASDDDGLGLDEPAQTTLSKMDVKQRLVEVMNTVGREDALNIMKKVGGARNFDEIAEDKYQAVYDAAGKALEAK